MMDMLEIRARKPSPMHDDRARKTKKKMNGMKSSNDRRTRIFILPAQLAR